VGLRPRGHSWYGLDAASDQMGPRALKESDLERLKPPQIIELARTRLETDRCKLSVGMGEESRV
jgi:hypothetical protein